MWLLGVHGRFGRIDGSVRTDPFRNQLRVDARIDVANVHMSRRSYEDWVKSDEFFDARAHPQITFVSEPFPRARLHTGGELPGELTVRGIRQSVRFELLPSECSEPAYACPIRVEGAIRRSALQGCNANYKKAIKYISNTSTHTIAMHYSNLLPLNVL